PGPARGCFVNRNCVGPAMAEDWGEDQPELTAADRHRMVARELAYFRPYWPPRRVAVARIAEQAVLWRAPVVCVQSAMGPPSRPAACRERGRCGWPRVGRRRRGGAWRRWPRPACRKAAPRPYTFLCAASCLAS